MSKLNLFSLLIFTGLLAGGQLLFKQVGLAMQGKPLLDGFLAVVRAPALYVALSVYGVSTLLWIWILSRIPLSQAYPWVAVGLGVVPLLAWFVFNERLGPAYWVGIGFVIVGVLITQYAGQAQ
jgi:drug/metabolite transporter (DMT)-like permease